MVRRAGGAALLFIALLVSWTAAQPPQNHRVVAATPSADAKLAAARIRVAEGLKVEPYVSEPLVLNPVAFCFDEKGRIYVAETFRLHQGVTDNRNHMYWLDDDIACQTVADRDAKYRKHLKDRYKDYTKATDRVRLLVDEKGTGRPDAAYVFSDDYKQGVDGLGSGVLAHEGSVYFTNIPDLWLLKDPKGENRATIRQSLSTGYGVHTSFIGHDLHGLVISPVDGMLYFSIGDRGANLVTKEGRKIEVPHTGAVFRCNLDGSGLELYAKGLRNPQELAFDDHGNLFTGDNNSDSGDRARFVYLPEGADCGWHIGFQYLEQPFPRGPWNAEYMWHPKRDEQPKYIVPPITNLGDGPSGLTFYPGTGLSERYKDHFFLADFRGTPTNSGIRSFAVKPKGAGFELTDSHQFAWGVLATDVDFGPDGALYILDWVEGWGLPGKGRIHRVSDAKQPEAGRTVKELLTSDWRAKSMADLARSLEHADRRVRVHAQFELVRRDSAEAGLVLNAYAGNLNGKLQANRASRLHAIWGLGQRIRAKRASTDSITILKSLIRDWDPQIVVNTLRVLGSSDESLRLTEKEFEQLFEHPNAHVKAQAAICLGKQGIASTLPTLLKFIRSNSLEDPWLRHACVMGLAPFMDKHASTIEKAAQSSWEVRLAMVLARRHRNQPPISFLRDPRPVVSEEAIRACHDLLSPEGLAALADLRTSATIPDHLHLRILNAWLHRGSADDAERLADYAGNSERPLKVRIEAIKMLAAWGQPPARDWVIGLWRPIPPRSTAPAQAALAAKFSALLGSKSRVTAPALRAAARLQLADQVRTALPIITDPSSSADNRVAALEAAAELKLDNLLPVVTTALKDADARIRNAAQAVLVKLHPEQAAVHLRQVLQRGDVRERQATFAQLEGMNRPEADQVLEDWVEKFAQGQVPAELQLDLVRATRKRTNAAWQAKLDAGLRKLAEAGPYGEHRLALAGGDRQAGRKVFFEKTAVACLRCHRVGAEGGEVGPELTHLGKDKTREYLLESLVDPNKTIAKDFELSIVLTLDGVVHQGVVKKETQDDLTLITPEARTVVIKKADIEERKTGKSAMPEDLVKQLSARELRDLIEYLAQLK